MVADMRKALRGTFGLANIFNTAPRAANWFMCRRAATLAFRQSENCSADRLLCLLQCVSVSIAKLVIFFFFLLALGHIVILGPQIVSSVSCNVNLG